MSVKQTVLKLLPVPVADAGRRARRRLQLEVERRGRLQRRVNRGISVDGLPRRRRQPGSVWAVCMAKNEEDVIGHSVRHMLGQGVDGVIVVDNCSTDGTKSVLDRIADEDERLHVGFDAEPGFHQGMKTSYLAHLAWRAGADWVLPFDADEFWFADGGTVADRLAAIVDDRVWGDYRTVYPRPEDGRLKLDSGHPVQVDREPTPWRKIAFRARRWAWVGEGNHDLRDLGPQPSVELHMLHYSCRSLVQYSRKATDGVAALEAAGMDETIATHWRSWTGLTAAEQSDRWGAYLRGERDSPTDASAPVDRLIIEDPTGWPAWDPRGVLAVG
jgi:hypothetical protein